MLRSIKHVPDLKHKVTNNTIQTLLHDQLQSIDAGCCGFQAPHPNLKYYISKISRGNGRPDHEHILVHAYRSTSWLLTLVLSTWVSHSHNHHRLSPCIWESMPQGPCCTRSTGTSRSSLFSSRPASTLTASSLYWGHPSRMFCTLRIGIGINGIIVRFHFSSIVTAIRIDVLQHLRRLDNDCPNGILPKVRFVILTTPVRPSLSSYLS